MSVFLEESFTWYVMQCCGYPVVQAYQYTSITSVMLLDCWAIPCVLLLTWLLLNSKYLSGHLIGALICVTGLALVILSDVHDNDRSGIFHSTVALVIFMSSASRVLTLAFSALFVLPILHGFVVILSLFMHRKE